MKLVKTLHFVLMLSLAPMLFAQGIQVRDSVTTSATNVQAGSQAPVYTVPYARIKVCSTSFCTTPIPVYQDVALTQALSQPVVADAQGKFSFYVAPGSYFEQVTNPGGSVLGTYPISPGAGTATASAVAVAQTSAYTALSTATTASANAIAAQTAALNAQTMAGTASSNATAAQTAATNAAAAVAAACPKSGCTLTGPIVAANDTPTGSQLASANFVANAVALVSSNAQTALTTAQTASTTATTALTMAQTALPALPPVAYAAGTTYAKNVLVFGSDNVTYFSLAAGNTGHDPTTTTGYWAKLVNATAGPAGANGVAGANGTPGVSPTLAAGTVTALAPGTAPVVTDSGSGNSHVFNFQIPSGTPGTNGAAGATGANGASPTLAVGTTSLLQPGSNPTVTDSGSGMSHVLNFAIPAGPTGPAGSGLSPAGSVANQDIPISGGAGNSTNIMTAAQQRSVDNALQIIKTVEDGPRTDVTSTTASWYAPGGTAVCPNAADNSGTKPSACAINAAISYASKRAAAISSTLQGQSYCVYVPPGRYLIDAEVDVPTGMCIIAEGATFFPTTGTNYSVMTIGNNRNGSSYPGFIGQLAYTIIDGLKFQGGNTPTSRNTLLEVNANGVVGNDLKFAQTAGVAHQINFSERGMYLRPSYYNNRAAVVMAGDDNETIFVDPTGLENGSLSGQKPSGSAFYDYCYGDNCVNGSFPAAGTTGSPTLLYGNTHAAIDIQRAVNVNFIGGDMKSNGMTACFRLGAAQDIKIDGMYCESQNINYPGGSNTPSIILSGQQARTTLTSAITPVTVNSQSLYQFSVASTDWFYMHYGNMLDVTYAIGDFQPSVIIPPDYVTGSTTASAYCPGLTQGEFEGFTTAATVGTSTVVVKVRNTNGAYDATANPTGAPANYDWSTCTQPATFEDATPGYSTTVNNGGNSLTLANAHLEATEGPNPGTVFNGYQWVQGYGAGPTVGEIAVGVTPSRVGPDLYTQVGTAGDPIAAMPNNITFDQPVQMFNGTNPFLGSIMASHRATITMQGGILNPDAAWNDANALIQDAGYGYSEHITLGPAFTYGSVFAFVGSGAVGSAGNAPVTFSAPSVGLTWDNSHGIYSKEASFFVGPAAGTTSNYVTGLQYANDYNFFPLNPTGHTKPDFRVHLTDGTFSVDSFNYTTSAFVHSFYVGTTQITTALPAVIGGQLTVNGSEILTGVVIEPSVTVTAATYTMPTTVKNVFAQATANPITVTLPACYYTLPNGSNSNGDEVSVIKDDSSSNAVTVSTSRSIYYLGAVSSSISIATPGTRTFVCASDNNWHSK